MPEETARLPGPPDSPPPLIFHWKRVRGARRRLLAFLLVAAAAHAALFYLFRVVPGVSTSRPPHQEAIIYLPPEEPGVRSLLSAINDRYPGAVVRSEDYNRQADLAALAAITPAAPPSWTGRRAALKPFTQPLAPQEMPRLMTPGDPLLPDTAPLPAPPATATATASGEGKPKLSAVPENSTRPVTRAAQWPDDAVDEAWPASGSVGFMLAIDRHGRPAHCMALSPGAGADLELIRTGLMAMRWETSPRKPLEWITLQVRW